MCQQVSLLPSLGFKVRGMRTLKMSAVIVLTFVICWTPYYLLGLWYWFSPEMLTREQVPPSLSHILFLFGLFNACLDPLIYGFFAMHFRTESGRACCCCPRREKEIEGASVLTGSFRASTISGGAARQLREPKKHKPESALARVKKLGLKRKKMAESFI